jgi:hypothetical protein
VKDQPRQYATAAAFRVALETRLNAIATAEKVDLQRLRRQISFDRLLARFFAERHGPWLLKGGYAMELRLRSARTGHQRRKRKKVFQEASKRWTARL